MSKIDWIKTGKNLEEFAKETESCADLSAKLGCSLMAVLILLPLILMFLVGGC